MVEDTQKRYADDITVQELVRLRVENERLRERVKELATALEFEANYDGHKALARAALKESE